MKTFKHFLEASIIPMARGEHESDLEKLAEIVKSKCSNSIKPDGDPYIWRGMQAGLGSTVPPSVVDPSTGERKSANTSNFYTLAMDSNPANAGWPKRSKSFICSTEYTTAKSYARGHTTQIFAVYPFNGVDLAQVGLPDIWHSRINFPSIRLRDKITAINIALGDADIEGDFSTLKDWTDAIKQSDAEMFKSEMVANGASGVLPPAEFVDAFIKDIPDAYSFENLGYELVNSAKDLTTSASEVWFSGKCVIIPKSRLEEFKALL